jgi:hypothetical protein
MRRAVRQLFDAVQHGVSLVAAGVAVETPHARRIIEEFRRAGALTPESSQPFRAQSPLHQLAFQELLKIAVIRQFRPGRYFLDERALRRVGAS